MQLNPNLDHKLKPNFRTVNFLIPSDDATKTKHKWITIDKIHHECKIALDTKSKEFTWPFLKQTQAH